MANTINIPRPHLIMGLCLPLAVLIGYFLAEPMDSGSIAVVLLVLSVLMVPILMKWYHPLLIISWNACLNPIFLPGRPFLWMIMAATGLFFGVLNRSVNPHRRFVYVPSLTKPLLFLAAVVVLTGYFTGGFGIRSLGGSHYGGKGYVFVLAAIAGYFAFTSQRIPPHRAGFYVALFFLSALTSLVANVAYVAGPGFYFLFDLFSPEGAMAQAINDSRLSPTVGRIGGLMFSSAGLYSFVLARYGIKGALDFNHPRRILLLVLAFIGCACCGYRSVLILFFLTFGVLFYFQGLWRTRMMPVLIGLGLLGGILVLTQAQRLPFIVQRTLSFLPVKVDPLVRESADSSTRWRLEMWKMVVPQVPKYLLKGKGYALDPNELFMAQESSMRGFETGAIFSGDYHNGPLSVVMPFGIWGLIGFGWFLVASVKYLYHNYRYGDAALHHINAFLLAAFIARIIFFTLVFGSLYSDFFLFTGLMGLSVSLNGAPVLRQAPQVSQEFLSRYSLRA